MHAQRRAAVCATVGWVVLFIPKLKERTMSVVTDGKHTNRVTIWLTDREYMDLCCVADAQDRKNSEMARFGLRCFMYGNLRPECPDGNMAISAKPSHLDRGDD